MIEFVSKEIYETIPSKERCYKGIYYKFMKSFPKGIMFIKNHKFKREEENNEKKHSR